MSKISIARSVYPFVTVLTIAFSIFGSTDGRAQQFDTIAETDTHVYLADTSAGFSESLIYVDDYPSPEKRAKIREAALNQSPGVDYSHFAYNHCLFEVALASWKYRRVFSSDCDASGRIIDEGPIDEAWSDVKDGTVGSAILNCYMDHERHAVTPGPWDTIGSSATALYITKSGQTFTRGSAIVVRAIPRLGARDSLIQLASTSEPSLDFHGYAFTETAYAVNCLSYSYMMIAASECNADGKAIRTTDMGQDWQQPQFGTISDAIIRYVCRRLK